MTSIRAFYILRDDDVLLSKRFPIVEKKIELLAEKFFPLSSDNTLLPLFIEVFKINYLKCFIKIKL